MDEDYDEDEPMLWDSEFDRIQEGINDRQSELHKVADILSMAAQRNRRFSAMAKVLIVTLGAVAATNGAATRLAGGTGKWVVVVYTVVGLAIAAVGGLDAAFKVSERAAELTILAATCQSAVREIDSRWHKEIGAIEGLPRVLAGLKLVELQDSRLTEVQLGAARLGVNIALQVRELYGISRPYLA